MLYSRIKKLAPSGKPCSNLCTHLSSLYSDEKGELMRLNDVQAIERTLSDAGHPGYAYPWPKDGQEIGYVEVRATGGLTSVIGALMTAGFIAEDSSELGTKYPYSWSGGASYEDGVPCTTLLIKDSTYSGDDLSYEDNL